MANFNVESNQNAEVSIKIPCEKPILIQLEIMENYTKTHAAHKDSAIEKREIECLKVLYPMLFRKIEDTDKFIGRLDFLPIGFGCVTSVGGVGHYCVFSKLTQFKLQLPEPERHRVDVLYNYWLKNDLKTKYCKDVLTDSTIGAFIDCNYPMIATARLSGMMLDYHKLLDLGIGGLRVLISNKLKSDENNEFYNASLESLNLFVTSAEHLKNMVLTAANGAIGKRKEELLLMADNLEKIKTEKPATFHQSLQLFWLYAMLAGVINYGRLDDILGDYLVADLANGTIDRDTAYEYLKSLWIMIENRRTTVNGRIIVGGRGRRNPDNADEFARLSLEVAANLRFVEPQFTLRFDKNTPKDIMDMSLDMIGKGATYPTLYNDDVNIPSIEYGMRLDQKAAEQYVPFGCTEFVIQGQSTGTPNVCINLLKLLTILLNEGIDPTDNQNKAGTVAIKQLEEFTTFEELYSNYKELLDYYIGQSIRAQTHSYKVMNDSVSFLFTSILMDDCIERGKALLDGGVRYLGGSNETYGNINASDSLYAIKSLVYDEKKYTLREIKTAMDNNFVGYDKLRKACIDCDKYGNDLDEVDGLANNLYEHVAKGVRQAGIGADMQYFLIVISNNQVNTEWGRTTAATPDGRLAGIFMNPANNPQGGAAKSGPTAMLNSLTKFNPKYHAGSVQNINFTPKMFNEDREKINVLFKTYFEGGGCHLMISVLDEGVLADAVAHPENHPDLLVRVSGFSAVFVNLEPDVQQEVMSRMLFNGK